MKVDLKALEFKADASKKSIDRAREAFEERDNVSSSIDYWVGGEKSNIGGQHLSAVCHGGIHRNRKPENADWCVTRISVWPDKDAKCNGLMRFVTSPDCWLSRFILNAETALTDRCIVVTGDVDVRIVHTLNLMSRATTEHNYEAIHIWPMVSEALPNDVTGRMLAVIITRCLSSGISRTYKGRVMFSGGHGKLLTSWSLKNIRNFVKGIAVEPLHPKTFRENSNYVGTSSFYGSGDNFDNFIKKMLADEANGFREKLSAFRNKSGAKAEKIYNPFVRQAYGAATEPHHLTITEFLEVFLPILDQEVRKEV